MILSPFWIISLFATLRKFKYSTLTINSNPPVVPGGAQWCPVVPGGARWCPVVPGGAQWCPVVPGNKNKFGIDGSVIIE